MKKNILILGLMAFAATLTSCSNKDDNEPANNGNEGGNNTETTMPEGTSDPRVVINETDAVATKTTGATMQKPFPRT